MYLISDHLSCKLEVLLPEAKLAQLGVDQPLLLVGSARLFQTSEGVLTFSFVGDGTLDHKPAHPLEFVRLMSFGISGEKLPPSRYFRLEGVDLAGHSWMCDKLLPGFQMGSGTDKVVATATLHHLEQAISIGAELPGGLSRISIPSVVDFPGLQSRRSEIRVGDKVRKTSYGRNVATLASGDFDIEFIKEDSHTEITIKSSSKTIPENFESRVIEALSFVVGSRFEPAVVERVSGNAWHTVYYSFQAGSSKRGSFTPVPRDDEIGRRCFWELFRRYLSEIVTYDGEGWSDLTTDVMAVIESQRSGLDVQMLILAIAVESLTKHFRHLVPRDADLTMQVSAFHALVDASDLDLRFKQRVKGGVSNYMTPSASDVLMHLVQREILDAQLVKAWKTMRHSHAHGAKLDVMEIDEFFRQKQSVLTLFHLLIFLLIGYQGVYTDFGRSGWPSVEFTHLLQAE